MTDHSDALSRAAEIELAIEDSQSDPSHPRYSGTVCKLGRALAADVRSLVEENKTLHSWDGIMSLLDLYYPADIFDGSSGDPGPRIVSLVRSIDQLKAEKQKLIEALVPFTQTTLTELRAQPGSITEEWLDHARRALSDVRNP